MAVTNGHPLALSLVVEVLAQGGGAADLSAFHRPDVVRRLISQGWAVEAEGRKHRTATATRAQVRSGIDW